MHRRNGSVLQQKRALGMVYYAKYFLHKQNIVTDFSKMNERE